MEGQPAQICGLVPVSVPLLNSPSQTLGSLLSPPPFPSLSTGNTSLNTSLQENPLQCTSCRLMNVISRISNPHLTRLIHLLLLINICIHTVYEINIRHLTILFIFYMYSDRDQQCLSEVLWRSLRKIASILGYKRTHSLFSTKLRDKSVQLRVFDQEGRIFQCIINCFILTIISVDVY